MKILQVNNCYKQGSTGKIVYDIHNQLIQRGVESVVCYGRGDSVVEENVYKICSNLYAKANSAFSRLTGVMYGGCLLSTLKLISIIKKEQPDVVHLHCINGYFVNIYRLVEWLKKSGIKIVLTLHAEFIHTANCGYALDCDKWKTGCGKCPRLKRDTKSWFFDGTAHSWNKMKKAFDGFNENLIVTSVSPWLMDRAKQSPILADKKHTVVFNGLDTSVFHTYDNAELRKELGISADEKIIFHATPGLSMNPDHIKGGYYVMKLAEKLVREKIRFVVAGPYDDSVTYPDNMIMLDRVSNQSRLAQLYSMADLTLLTSKKETFSMICAESLSCGTPVVGFKAGAPEQISLKEYSTCVEHGDENALMEAVLSELSTSRSKEEISQLAKQTYSKQIMTDNYFRLY